jgi:hypothetical protein
MGWEDDLNEGKQANNGEERQGDAQWDARSGREAAFDPHSEADKQRRYQPTPGAKPWRKHVAKHIGERPGRISPTAKMTPVTAKARESSVRSAERDASGLRRAWRLVLSPPRFAIA